MADKTVPTKKKRSLIGTIFHTTLWTFIGASATVAATLLAYVQYKYPDHSINDKLQDIERLIRTGSAKNPQDVPSGSHIREPIIDKTEPPAAPIQTVSTSGISASVKSAEVRDGRLYIDFELENRTGTRFYFTDARGDGSQIAILSSGGHLEGPMPAGINYCNGPSSDCLTNVYETVITKYQPLDAGAKAPASFSYNISAPDAAAVKFVSTSVMLVGRFANTLEEASNITPQPYRLSFNDLPVMHR